MSEDSPQRQRKRPRKREIGVTFVDGFAQGWAFGVPETFKEAMDIRFGLFVDKEATKALRKAKGSRDEDGNLRTIWVREWRIGDPPARAFRQGDIFYSPREARNMVWRDALNVMRHAIVIKDAVADRLEDGKGGWVEFTIDYYVQGAVTKTARRKVSQDEFETILKTGEVGAA